MQLACLRVGRPVEAVRLIAVSKAFPASALAALVGCGQLAFGESYLQEALPKMEALGDPAIEWHFIGRVQGNKTRQIAAHFQWAQAVDRLDIAQRLGGEREARPLDICLQINVSAEASKAGVSIREAPSLCASLARIEGLRLRGLMAVPATVQAAEAARAPFRELRSLFDRIRNGGRVDPAQFDTVSMGMSDDFEVAIEEGATMIRIGSALFGPRPARP